MPTDLPDPLANVNPSSLEELFSKDPLELQDQDLDAIVTALRAQRAKFLAQPEKAPSQRKPKLVKVDLGQQSPQDFLKDLGL